MTEPEKEPTSEDVNLEQETLEEATLEETRAQGEQEFDSTLYRLVAITGLISFYGPILFPFFFLFLGFALSSASAELFARILILSFFAIPISAIVGLFSCLLLWFAPTTKADLKPGIVFSALADVFGLGFSVLAPFILIALSPFGD